MTGPQSRFSTFCHISEYATDRDEYSLADGYHNLHRMIAASYPLNLWSPSSVYLRDPLCRVSPADFLKLIEDGYVRVLGRRAWIYNEDGWRSNLAPEDWKGRLWDDYIDGGILAIHLSEERARVPDEERHVVIANDERGYDVARELLADHPDYEERLYEAYERNSGQIPSGTRGAVQRDLERLHHGNVSRRRAVALTILRDAHNHARAAADSGAEAPFLLGPHDSAFMRLLAELPAGPLPLTASGEAVETLSYEERERLAELTRQVIGLLRDMDRLRIAKGELREDRNVRNWVGGEGHRLMASWFHGLCRSTGRISSADMDGYVVRRLRSDIADSARSLGVVDLAMASLPTGEGLIQELGYLPEDYPGEQWPYLYLFNEKATLTHAKLLSELLGA
jgi:hypothetical protein